MSYIKDYLNNVVSGTLNPKGNLGDFSHAAKLFTHSAYRLSPKTKFLYHVVFELSDDARRFATTFSLNPVLLTEFGLLVKSIDLPKMTMQVDTKNQYNRKKNVQTAIAYDPINVTFHDDSLGITTALLEGYYRYYFKDGNYATNGLPPQFDPRNTYKGEGYHRYRYGFDNDSIGPFFSKVVIYQLSRHQYTSFTLVNPIITNISHDTMDYSDATSTVQNQAQIAYEGVFYDRGRIKIDDPKGFGTVHYDRQASPLTILGGGTSTLFGPGGVVEGLAGVFDDIATGNVGLGTIIEAVNTYRNAKDLSKKGIKREGINILTGVAGAAIITGVAGVANTVFPKNTGKGAVTQNGPDDITTRPSRLAAESGGTAIATRPSRLAGTQTNNLGNAATGGAVDVSNPIYREKIASASAANNIGG